MTTTTTLLTTERLKAFSDSVLLVAITLLAYNLVPPSAINGELVSNEVETFFDNLFGLISSFFVIFVFWIIYTKILDYLKQPDDVIMLVSMAFFLLVLLTPIFTVAQVQYTNLRSVITLALLEIINSVLLMLLWTYLTKGKTKLLVQEKEEEQQLSKASQNRYIYSGLGVIISLYLFSIGISFFNISLAIIFPVIMLPAMMILARLFNPRTN